MNFLPGVHRAPNIQTSPSLYEVENRATDPDGLIEQSLRAIGDWGGKVVVDMGAGTGFYVPLFHEEAAHVIAVEPHDASRRMAMARVVELGLDRVSVMTGSAEAVLLPNRSVDYYHSRFAYFWPPDCEKGIFELDRIMAPGGVAVIIDSDYEQGQFGRWLASRPKPEKMTQEEKERFWASFGFSLKKVVSEWRFESRKDLEAVVTLEFGKDLAPHLLADHSGLSIGYIFCLYYRSY